MSTHEILLEKLHLLQIHNTALENNRALNSLILNGLDAILNSASADTLFEEFFKILQHAISFSGAILIQYDNQTKTHKLVTASHPHTKQITDTLTVYIRQNHEIKNIYNLHQLPSWKITNPFWHSQHAMLTTPIHTSAEHYQLFIFSTRIGAFNQHDINLLQRFVSFAGNTISQFEQRKLLIKHKKMAEKHSNIEQVLINSEKMASLGQMAAGVAHEINNPLSYIMSNIQNIAHNLKQHENIINTLKHHEKIAQEPLNEILTLYKYDDLQDDSNDIIDEMKEGAERVKDIVQGLRQFAHPDQTKIDKINIAELIDGTLRVAWNQIKYNATIEKHYCCESVIVTGRKTQLSQVFLNIFVNAAQALSDSMGIITVTTEHDANNAYITIADNGCGIAADQLTHIFDPFFTTKPVGKGTGLGLAISKAIIAQHGGDISVESELNIGTVFSITLPKKPTLNDEALSIISLGDTNDD